jgi:hypothetical protein
VVAEGVHQAHPGTQVSQKPFVEETEMSNPSSTLCRAKFPYLPDSMTPRWPAARGYNKPATQSHPSSNVPASPPNLVNPGGLTLRGAGEPESVFAVQATINFFSTLGVKPMLGRDFHPGEDVASRPYVAILAHGFWRRRFGGDPQVIGRSIQLDSNNVTIIGVLPGEFEFAPRGNVQIWVPLHIGQGMATRRNLR